MTQIEFFYDCSSPWTYLAFNGLQPIAAKYGADIVWRPILVGGVFNAVNKDLYQARETMFANERRMSYFMKDLSDWAKYEGLKIDWPEFHPVNSVMAMRACFYAQAQGQLIAWSRRVFEAYWGESADISDVQVLKRLAADVRLDGEAMLHDIQQQATKDKLRANTDELIARGGFGSPTMFINGDDMYFGNDRLLLVERALAEAC